MIAQWRKISFVTSNTSKTKLVIIIITELTLNFHPSRWMVAPHALKLKFYLFIYSLELVYQRPQVELIIYDSLIKTFENCQLLTCSREYLSPAALLYLYRSQIRPKMEYCCYILFGFNQSPLTSIYRVQRDLRCF